MHFQYLPGERFDIVLSYASRMSIESGNVVTMQSKPCIPVLEDM